MELGRWFQRFGISKWLTAWRLPNGVEFSPLQTLTSPWATLNSCWARRSKVTRAWYRHGRPWRRRGLFGCQGTTPSSWTSPDVSGCHSPRSTRSFAPQPRRPASRFSTLPSDSRFSGAPLLATRPRNSRYRGESLLRRAEIHLGSLARSLGSNKVSIIPLESSPPGKDVIREKTDVGVVILDGLVIAAALDGDAVFGSGQLVLKGQEVLIGFEIGIVLDDGQQPAQGAIQLAIRSDPVCRRSGAQQGGAGIIDVSEHFHLLRRITFHGCHEIRNQVGAPLQHHIYLRPCLFDSLIFADHLVSAADVRQSNNEANQRQYSHHNQ